MKSSAVFIAVLLAAAPIYAFADRVIGHVGQQSIHESQIQGATEQEREISLRRLFVSPVLKRYLEAHRSEWQLTEQETQQLADAFKAWMKCNPLPPSSPPMPADFERMAARMMGEKAKRERFIYDNHGRGRVLFQQAGNEAFDATRNLILQLEKQGEFAIDDPELRALTLKYWLDDQHGILSPDPGPDKAFKLELLLGKCAPA